MWFSSEPPEHLAVFNGQIVASDSLGRQHRIKAYDEVSALWSDIGDGSRDGKPIVGLAAVEKQLYAVSWDALSRQLDEARSETESGGQTENGHEALPRFVYTVHCSSDCSAETNNSGAGALALVEGEMHALEVGNVGQDSPSSGLISVRDPCLLEQQGWWTRVAQFRSTVKLDLAICTGVSL